MLIAINHHYVRQTFDAPHPGIHGARPEKLEAQWRALSTVGTFVSGLDLRDALEGGVALPDPAFLLTFDDGLREQVYHALPVLDALGLPAVFFVNTGPIVNGTVSRVHKIHLLRSQVAPEDFVTQLRSQAFDLGELLPELPSQDEATAHYRYDDGPVAQLKFMLNFTLPGEVRDRLVDAMFAESFGSREADISRELYVDPQQIRALGEHHCVGSHAHEHLPLGLLEERRAADLLDSAADLLEQWAGYRPYALSYPYGSAASAPEWAGEVGRAAGARYAFTTHRAPNVDLRRPMHRSRFDNNDVPGGKNCEIPPRAWLQELRRQLATVEDGRGS